MKLSGNFPSEQHISPVKFVCSLDVQVCCSFLISQLNTDSILILLPSLDELYPSIFKVVFLLMISRSVYSTKSSTSFNVLSVNDIQESKSNIERVEVNNLMHSITIMIIISFETVEQHGETCVECEMVG